MSFPEAMQEAIHKMSSRAQIKPTSEWINFADPRPGYEGWIVSLDVAWLLGTWGCIWRNGCPGAFMHEEVGCCSIGAHFADDTDRNHTLERVVDMMSVNPDGFTYRDEIKRHLDNGTLFDMRTESGKTRIHEGACIFANRNKRGEGYGCSLHGEAMRRGENYIDWKPEICWAIPHDVEEDDDEECTYLSRHEAVDWGEGDWNPLDYWCVEDKAAYDAHAGTPVFMRDEDILRKLWGDALYDAARPLLEKRYGWTPVELKSKPHEEFEMGLTDGLFAKSGGEGSGSGDARETS